MNGVIWVVEKQGSKCNYWQTFDVGITRADARVKAKRAREWGNENDRIRVRRYIRTY